MTVILVFQPRNRTFVAISVNKDVSRQWLQASSVAWWAPRALGKEDYLPVSSQQTIATAYGEPWATQDVETQDPDPRELRHTAQERCQPARLLNLPIHGKALNSNPLTWIIWFALIYKKTFDIEDHRPFVANLLYSLAPTSTSSERCSQGHLRCCLQGPSPKNFHQIKHNSVF